MNSKLLLRLGVVYFILSIGTAIGTYFYTLMCHKVQYAFDGNISGSKLDNFSNLDLRSFRAEIYSNEGVVIALIVFAALFFVFGNVCLYWGTKLKNAGK